MTEQNTKLVGLRWTGHVLVDAGIAALTAFGKKQDPTAVTVGDLDEFVDFAVRHYLSSDMSKTVGILFTINSFQNPSIKSEERRRERIRDAVGAFRHWGQPESERCTFCGAPSIANLHRDDIPMLLGRSVINFYPGGRAGLAICGLCQTSLHGLSLGAPRCSGKALVVHADDPKLTLRLVRRWVSDAVRNASLAAEGGSVPEIKMPRTRLIAALIDAQKEAGFQETESGIVAYSLSNSGQGPGIDIYTLPSSVVGFIAKARTQRTARAWQEIERRAWQPAKRDLSAADVSNDERMQYQNYLYEDLFRLPEDARRFIRIYFLRNAAGLVRSGDPRADYRAGDEANLISWNLTSLFLQEVLSMDRARVEAIRSLGDSLAEQIIAESDRRLFQRAYRIRGPRDMRRLLLNVNLRRLNRDAEPVLTLDDYLEVFEEGEELARTDWRLAWDLVLIRLIEQLYEKQWLRQNREALDEAVKDTDAETDESTE